MKFAVVGSRDIVDKKLVENILSTYSDITTVVSGGARGIDTWAENWAVANGLDVVVFEPDWKKHGKAAGFIRNSEIIEAADVVVAIWDGESRGTLDSITKAIKTNKPCDVWLVEGGNVKRIQSEVTLS